MKNILLLLSLFIFPLVVSAKFCKAKITFSDGSSKNGFIQFSEYPDDYLLEFRITENGKTREIKSEEVDSLEVIYDANNIIKYSNVKVAESRLINAEISPFSNKKRVVKRNKDFMQVLKEGKISLYIGTIYKKGSDGILYNTFKKAYYFKKENDDCAKYLYGFKYQGVTFYEDSFLNFKNTIKSYFDEECPKLAESLNEEDFVKKGMSYIVDLYEQNCGK